MPFLWIYLAKISQIILIYQISDRTQEFCRVTCYGSMNCGIKFTFSVYNSHSATNSCKWSGPIVEEDYCGTHAPGYIKSSEAHPKITDEVVRAKVCFHWDSNTCKWSTTIKIRNCETFFIYYLVEPLVCRLRYCTI